MRIRHLTAIFGTIVLLSIALCSLQSCSQRKQIPDAYGYRSY